MRVDGYLVVIALFALISFLVSPVYCGEKLDAYGGTTIRPVSEGSGSAFLHGEDRK